MKKSMTSPYIYLFRVSVHNAMGALCQRPANADGLRGSAVEAPWERSDRRGSSVRSP